MFQKPIIFGIIQLVKFRVLINSGIFPLPFLRATTPTKLYCRAAAGGDVTAGCWGLILDVAGRCCRRLYEKGRRVGSVGIQTDTHYALILFHDIWGL